jgi:hypothetical protein
MTENTKERRKNPVFRCPEGFRNRIAEASVELIKKRLIEASKRRSKLDGENREV